MPPVSLEVATLRSLTLYQLNQCAPLPIIEQKDYNTLCEKFLNWHDISEIVGVCVFYFVSNKLFHQQTIIIGNHVLSKFNLLMF